MSNTPKTTAKRSRNSKSITTAIIKANAVNASARVRQFTTDDGLITYLDEVVMKSPAMPASLANDTSKNGARVRREWCVKNGIRAVRAYDDGMMERRAGMPKNENGWRPDNAVKTRLVSIMGKFTTARFHYTRCETNWTQYQAVLELDWSNGLPDNFNGADEVFVYRVGK